MWRKIFYLSVVVAAILFANNAFLQDLQFDVPRPLYDSVVPQFPKIQGQALRGFIALLENSWPVNGVLAWFMRKEAKIGIVRAFVNEALSTRVMPTYTPLAFPSEELKRQHATAASQFSIDQLIDLSASQRFAAGGGFQYATVEDYNRAYASKKTNPEAVVKALLAVISDESKHLNSFVAFDEAEVLQAAKASNQRLQQNKPLSILDGVPIAVKDELDVKGFVTTAGTGFLQEMATEDSTAVKRFRDLGAIIIGKTNMHEIGIGVTGHNPHHGVPQNPYNTSHYPGGSSSGSGVAVGAGIVPIAIGADGGGSVRIPASFCGVVGLKPTYSRISEHGVIPLAPSVGHLGPLAGSVRDAAIGYAVMSGYDSQDPGTMHQPAVYVDKLTLANSQKVVKGLKIGVFQEWFDHADAVVVDRCRSAIEGLKKQGATIVPITIPHLDVMSRAHVVLIVTEMLSVMDRVHAKNPAMFGLDVRNNLFIASHLKPMEYLDANKVRTFALNLTKHIFDQVDVIATPTTGVVSPSAELEETSDLTTLMGIIRFATFGNIVGIPALTVPVGYVSESNPLPVGLQLMANHWNENLLFQVGLAVEHNVKHFAPVHVATALKV